jgi:hypothetical protein
MRPISVLMAVVVLTGLPGALYALTPPADYLPPVISKLQMVFSLVAHHNSVSERVNFYNTRGSPLGNANYAVPHLVYEPLITLYNPYDTELILNNVRIKIWDPPVGFRFKKNENYLRNDGEYHGLARFQFPNEKNAAASKTFTLQLQNYASGGATSPIVIPPGETRTFSTYIEPSWTWGEETATFFAPKSLFDFYPGYDYTNKDGNTGNPFGVECSHQVFGWDTRGGFQTDHLSYSSGRPPATAYPFEAGTFYGNSGWVVIKLSDTVSVESRALRTAPSSSDCDFRVDLLGGIAANAEEDIYRSFKFNLSSLVQPNGSTPETPAVSSTYTVGNLVQAPSDMTSGGKAPFAVFTMVAKAQALMRGSLETIAYGDANDLYDLRFDEMYDFAGFHAPGPVTEPPTKPSIFATSVNGNTMTIDFIGPRNAGPWSIEGGPNLDAFPNDLTPKSIITEGPDGTGIRKATIDITERGSAYFLRLKQ